MRLNKMPRIGTKLRSLMTRVLRRCSLDEQSIRRRRNRARRAGAYIQPLESRQLMSVAIEMVVNPTGAPDAYVVDGSDVYASQSNSFTIDFYVTHDGTDGDSTDDTLFAFDLNLTGTSSEITLNNWIRNTDLFANVFGDEFTFADDTLDAANGDYYVSAATITQDNFDADDMTMGGGVTGWKIGSLVLTLPDTVGEYNLTFSNTDPDEPTFITHGFADEVNPVTSSPDGTGLTFHVTDAPTLSIEDLDDVTGASDLEPGFAIIDITTNHVDASKLTLSDFVLTRTVNDVQTVVISDLDNQTNTDNDWEDYSGVSLVDAGNGLFYIVGLDEVLNQADGEYTLTAAKDGVVNDSDVPLGADVSVTFNIDTATPHSDDDIAGALALESSRQRDLSLHNSNDVDWRSLDYDGTGDLLTLATVYSEGGTGAQLTVQFFDTDGTTQIGSDMLSVNGTLNQSIDMSSYGAGTYYFKIFNADGDPVYDYSFAAGEEDNLNNIVEGTVFVDDDFDGDDDDGLGGWENITVQLLDSSDNVLDTTTTNALGEYVFENVLSDTVHVRIVLPDGTFQTTADPADIELTGADVAEDINFGVRDVTVEGRHLFYNDSSYDTTDDSDAIAPDKSPLMAGDTEVTASFENYSGYYLGINGIAIDIVGLSSTDLDVADDFTFEVSSGAGESMTWSEAPAPASIQVVALPGEAGAYRVLFTWANRAIADQWLRVTMQATDNTGLGDADEFYYGNSIADTGNNSAPGVPNPDAQVNISDVNLIWSNQSSGQGAITNQYDLTKDGAVNISDVNAAWSNFKSSSALPMLKLPGSVQSLSLVPPQQSNMTAQSTTPSSIALLALHLSRQSQEATSQFNSSQINDLTLDENDNAVKLLLVE